MHDVVVVGAGIAGVATAIALARRDRSVLLVDRARGPQRKTCGEGLFPYGVAELDRLGIDARPYGCELRSLRFHSDRDTAEAPLGTAPNHGLGIRREVLADLMLEAASKSGVSIMLNTMVEGLAIKGGRIAAVRSSRGPLPGRAFVAADGLNSRLRRRAGLEGRRRGTRFGISAHVQLAHDLDPGVDVYVHDGYEVYRTPVGRRTVNVALLLERQEMPRFAGRLNEEYQAVLSGHPATTGAVALEDEPLAAGPFSRSVRRAWRANLVLAGDAAGFFDGISGDGMSSALASAPLCAAAVDRFLTEGSYDSFVTYDRERIAAARLSNDLAQLTLELARRPTIARFAIRNMARQPETFERLVGVMGERKGLGSLRPADLPALAFGI